MRRLAVTLAVMLVCHAAWGSPAEALAVAVADARTLSKEDGYYCRYLSLTHWHPQERLEKVGTGNFWLNSLNRGRTKGRPVLLGKDAQVMRVDLRDYHIDPKVWERLGLFEAQEPYFHRPKTEYTADKKATKNINEQATWLPPADVKELMERTQSWVPIVRLDWFVWMTGQQVNRGFKDKTFGYYDFLGVRNQQDFFDMIGADAKKNAELQTVVAARVARSGVALNNRGIARQGTVTGGAFWATADFKTSRDRQNVIRLLRDKDTHPPRGDASEQYGTLPNGLFAFFLANADGTRQDVVPPDIAGDRNGIANDLQVHFRSCVQCHTEGLRPIDDFVRDVIRGPQLRTNKNPIAQELEALYLNNLPLKMHRDLEIYREALAEVNGLSPEENARRFRAMNQEYFGDEVSLEQAAFELGFTAQKFREILDKNVRDTEARRVIADPLIAGLAKTEADDPGVGPPRNPSRPLRREHFEELIGVFYDLYQGVIP